MNIILLSGGSGTRLWPLSNGARAKQFLKLLQDKNGNQESMVQRVFRQLREARLEPGNILVSTSADQQDPIRSQLGDRVEIVVEPERRNTFAAILLSTAYLHFEKRCSPEEVVVVMPVDTYTEPAYFDTLRRMANAVHSGVADLVLMGIKPLHPAEKYGYMLPKAGQASGVCPIERFVEKPPAAVAQELIANGARWNGGVFAFRLGYLMDIAAQTMAPASLEDVRQRYGELRNESFDYEVVEKATSIAMVPFDGLWKDLGTWNSLAEEMCRDCIGKSVLSEDVHNTHVINELDIPVVVLAVSDLVVVASPDGILVSDKDKSASLKHYVSPFEQRPMYEERHWGEYWVIDRASFSDADTLTKHFYLKAGTSMGYQRHARRDELWTLIDGVGELVLDGQKRPVGRGEMAHIPKGCRHALWAITDIHAIEVQIGEGLTEDDIEFFDWQWH